MKIPSQLRMKDDESLAQFIETLCTTCRACPNLISLLPDTEDCEKCTHSKKRQISQTSTPPTSPVIPEKRKPQTEDSKSDLIKQLPTSSSLDANIGSSISSTPTSTTTNGQSAFNPTIKIKTEPNTNGSEVQVWYRKS